MIYKKVFLLACKKELFCVLPRLDKKFLQLKVKTEVAHRWLGKNYTVVDWMEKIKKLYKALDTPCSFEISIFCKKLRILVISRNKDKKLHFNTWFAILLTIIEFLKIILMNVIAVVMISEKLSTPSPLKITAF